MKKMLFGFAHAAIAMQAAGEGAAAAIKETAPEVKIKPSVQNGDVMAGRFTMEQIKEIRALRAMRYPEGHEKANQVCWSHKQLAEKFGTTPGVISHIVRNRTYKDPDYTPVNDGHLDRKA